MRSLLPRTFICAALIDPNGDIRAHPETQPAPVAPIGIDLLCVRMALFIQMRAHSQIILRTKHYTQAASFAAMYVKCYFTHVCYPVIEELNTVFILSQALLSVNK